MTVFVLGQSGVVQEIDIPTDSHAAERFQASVDSGEFRIVDKGDIEAKETRHGGVIYVLRGRADRARPGVSRIGGDQRRPWSRPRTER